MSERVDYSSDEEHRQAELSEQAMREEWEKEEYAKAEYGEHIHGLIGEIQHAGFKVFTAPDLAAHDLAKRNEGLEAALDIANESNCYCARDIRALLKEEGDS